MSHTLSVMKPSHTIIFLLIAAPIAGALALIAVLGVGDMVKGPTK